MKKTNNGFSLVEVLIAISVVAVGMMGTLALVQTQFKSSNYVNQSNDVDILHKQISTFLSDTKNCSINFQNIVANGEHSATGILDFASQIRWRVYDTTHNDTYENVKINSIIMKNFLYNDPSTTTDLKGKATLAILYRFTKNVIGPSEVWRRINIFYNVKSRTVGDPTIDQIDSCTGSSGSTSLSVLCNAGTYLSGFDLDGNSLCTDFPHCMAGQSFTGFDASGAPICEQITNNQINFVGTSCTSPQFMTGIDSMGHAICATPNTTSTTCNSPAGSSGASYSASCPAGQTGTITYNCAPPNWVVASNNCTPLLACRQRFYDPQLLCNGAYRYVRQSQANSFCVYKGFDSGVKIVEHRVGPAVCQWNGTSWEAFDQASNGTLGTVECIKNPPCM